MFARRQEASEASRLDGLGKNGRLGYVSGMFERMTAPIGDYGGYHRSSGEWFRFAPADEDSLRAGLAQAAERSMSLRVRGAGHSMNGSAIPRVGELLIETRALDSWRIEASRSIRVGAGAAIWDVQRLLASLGHGLLVYNDGNAAASTVGGYVSAGGFGAESWRYGGFWESVESIDLVTVGGESLTVGPSDPLFPWLFGSMGQLGIIVAATLKARPLPGALPLARGSSGRVPASVHDWEKTIWFSAFVPKPAWGRARRELAAIGGRHSAAWRPRPPYAYAIPFGRFTPPLIHPSSADLVAVGIWGEAPEEGFDFEALRAIDCDFTSWLRANPDFRRYAQSELLFEDFGAGEHFGAGCLAGFRERKRVLDPAGRLAPGPISGDGAP
ncbi:MAG TPA: FAD-binding oxidoreductase [Allosphingosinicella sp.]|nr:FAD-binding oxidoreductase [Allosphingosinicella sp.]